MSRLASATLLALLAVGALAGCAGDAPRRVRAVPHAPRSAPFDVEHYAIDIALDPVRRTLEGTCTVRLWAVERPLRRVRLDLAGLEARAVRDGAGRSLDFHQAGETLEIELAEGLAAGPPGGAGAPGEFVELAIDYGGAPVRGLWFTGPEDGVATQVFTQGQCEDARFWFPCWDAPDDRVTSELRVRMPAGWIATAAGERIERVVHGDGTASELWRMHDSHPTYLISLVAGELTAVEARHGDLPLVYLVEDRWLGEVEPTFGETPRVLDFMAGLAGRDYPYAKYSQACVEGFVFGGMENVSATTMTETLLRDERGRRDEDPLDLVAHEAAHQWFGDLVTCADWSHIWLNEGFATYATLLYLEETRGIDEFRARMRDAQEAYLRGDVGSSRRPIVHDVYVDPLDLFFDGHAYPGGASRLHLLRFVLGDEAFFRGVRRYVADHQNGSVTTADLRAALEAESGQDLGRFFAQWLYAPGFPELEWGWEYEPEQLGQPGQVVIQVAQVQDPATAPSVFETPVDVEVRTEGESRVHRVQLDRRHQRIALPSAERPLWVHLDRLGWIPKTERIERPLDEWLAIASLDDDVNARRDAVAVLAGGLAAAGRGQRQALSWSLIERLVEDPSRFVRARAAAGLGGVGSPPVLDSLRAAAEADPEAAVRVAALDALARSGPDGELAAFARTRFEAGFSWETMAAAARLYAAADPAGAEAFLVERLAIDSPHDTLRARLLVTLGGLGGERIERRLRDVALDEDASEWARLAALTGLGGAVRRDTALADELARLLLTTRHYRLQTGLIELLGGAEQARAVPALEDFHARCEDPEQRRAIERYLRQPWAR